MSHENDGNWYVYVCWIGKGAEKEVEYVTISTLWKVWNTLKKQEVRVAELLGAMEKLAGNGSEEWVDTSCNN